ncbi:MAG: alpha/beta hydrolase [Pseudomonadota bacterium]
MRRGLLLAGLLFILTGCGGADERAPFTESRIPPALGPRFWAPEGWAWGLIGVGDAPVQRYGVSSSAITPRASILILSGYGESAEVWFETARALNAEGFNVWVLERAGQGGSERYVSPRDLGHAPTFDGDIAATRALTRMIVADAPDRPLVILGHSVGGLIAAAAVERGLPVDGLILSAPSLGSAAATDWRDWPATVGLGRIPASLGGGWRRGSTSLRPGGASRDVVQMAWQIANPDLRMGGQTLGWKSAFRTTGAVVRRDLSHIEPPALILIAERDHNAASLRRACGAMARCTSLLLSGGRHALHLDADPVRDPWLAAVTAFLRSRVAARG